MAKKQHDSEKSLKNTVSRWNYAAYLWCYGLGMYALMWWCRAIRYLRRETRPSRIWVRNYIFRPIKGWVDTAVHILTSVYLVMKEEFEGYTFSLRHREDIRELCRRLRAIALRYIAALKVAGRVAAPLVAALILTLTISYWVDADFGIEIVYEDQKLGYVASESTYHQAADLARTRVHSESGEFTISDTPKMAVRLVQPSEMLDNDALCNEILRTKGDAIAEASGLYVDGAFIGSMKVRGELDAVLDGIKNQYKTGAKNERAEFIQKVEVVDGLFLSDSLLSADQMKGKLTAQAVVKKEYTVQSGDTIHRIARLHDMTAQELRNMNPAVKNDLIYAGTKLTVQRPQQFLRVQVIRTIEYTEKIAFTTEKKYNNTKPVTWEKVHTKGVDGSQTVTAEVTYIDGVEQSRNILSINVTKQPVTKVVEVGTKKVVTGGMTVTQGDGVSTGNMLWPVPICKNMSRGWGRGHYALDICNGPVTVNGKPFVAADGGTVVSASYGRNGGYGNVVRIRHANGLETVYAHCKSLHVVTGQKVTRGQTLGLIGSTGRSSGPHLHFEVLKNGRRVNPLNYVKR